jgi:hypothetical protein
MFKRRSSAGLRYTADAGVSSAVIVDSEAAEIAHGASREEAWRRLRHIAAEAVILQDAAEELLIELRDQRNLAQIAPPCGRLMARFVSLGHQLPSCGDPVMDRHTAVLRTIFDHHIYMLNSARALLAAEWRSERLSAQLDRIEGLGEPARRLEHVRAEILWHFGE